MAAQDSQGQMPTRHLGGDKVSEENGHQSNEDHNAHVSLAHCPHECLELRVKGRNLTCMCSSM